MVSLILNFLKRAVAVPLIVTAVVIAGITVLFPVEEETVSNSTMAVNTIELSSFGAKKYSSFKQLDSDDFAGTLKSNDFAFGEIAVLFDAQAKNYASIDPSSSEPWNGGTIIINGKNNESQLRPFHRAKVGDKIIFDAYSNDKYTYKIKKILVNRKKSDIKKCAEQGKLIVCVPYSDFTDLRNSFFYTIYIAE